MSLKLVKGPKGSPNYYLRGSIRGQSVYETTGTDNHQAAEDIRIKKEAQLLQRSIHGEEAAEHTFAEAALSYLENGGEARFLGVYDQATGKWSLLLGELGRLPIKSIGQDQVNRACTKLYGSCKNSTKKRHCYIPVVAVLHHAESLGWIVAPKIRHPKVDPVVTTYSSLERTAALLPHCCDQLRLFIVMTAYTGARLSEALWVDWDRDIELQRRKITFQRTKTGKKRVVEIHEDLFYELSKVPHEDRHGRVFRWTRKQSVYVPLKNACKRAGVPYLPPHQQGRHTFGSLLRIHGKRDVKGIMEDGGWESVSSAIRYLHTDPGESGKAVANLPSSQPVEKTWGDKMGVVKSLQSHKQNR